MTFMEALTNVIAPLWPVLLSLGAFFGVAVVAISKREVNRKLFHEDGSLHYATAADLDQFKADVASSLADFKDAVAKEFAKHKTEVEDMCATNQANCNQRVCLKIDGVLDKLGAMDEKRKEARDEMQEIRKERLEELKEHTKQMTALNRCLSNLTGRFEQLEKHMSNTTH